MKREPRLLWGALFMAIALAACSGGGGDGAAGDADADSDADADGGGDADVDTDAGGIGGFETPDDVLGTWAQKMELDGRMKIKLAQGGAPLVSSFTLTMLYVTEVQADGAAYQTLSKSCDLFIDSRPGVGLQGDITIPKSFFENLGQLDKPLAVSVDGQVTQGDFTELRGFDEEAFEPTDPMPEFGSENLCGCTADPDGDGHAGMTLQLDGSIIGLITMEADLYGVERDVTAIEGRFDDRDHISGLVTWTLEMAILGVVQKNDYQYVFNAVDPPAFEQSDRLQKSRVRMARVDEGFTCDDLLADGATLFADGPFTY